MLIFNPSKLKFFKKDGDGDDDTGKDGVTTFFDTLNLKGSGGGSSNDSDDDDSDDDKDKKKSDDDNPNDKENPDDKDKLSPELIAMQEQLKASQEQTAKLLAIVEKGQIAEEKNETLEDPFETEAFDNYAKAMDWDDAEKKANKIFMQSVFDFQNQTTLATASASVTDIVNSSLSQADKKKAVQEQFFTENPKLKPVKDYVSTVATGVFKEYKALGKVLNPAEILKEAASRAYKVLGIDPKTKGKNDNESESDHDPAFPSSRQSSQKRNQKVNKTTTQKMITSMIDL